MTRCPRKRLARPAMASLALLLLTTTPAFAQTTSTTAAVTSAPVQIEPLTATETLVGRFALYPDDLVALVVPAATYPLQVVDAARYLEKRKTNNKLPVPESWDSSVKALANYPEVIAMMNDDLVWTEALGAAIVADQAAVLDAVQSYRRKVMAAGNLKTDQKQVVTVEKEVVTIAPADPQVIYIPQYQPASMVVYGAYPGWGYYGWGYPSYYYPYAPGAAFAAGLIWGAAIGGWYGPRYGYWGGGSINIDNNFNGRPRPTPYNGAGGGNIANRPDRGTAWQPTQRPANTAGNRVGDPGALNRAGLGGGNYSPTAGTMDRPNKGSYGPSAGTMDRPSRGTYGPPASAGTRDVGGNYAGKGGHDGGNYASNRSAFGTGGSGGYGNRAAATTYSQRGAASRGMARSGGGRRR